jgi:N-dimethylarginine dimethylaminohydrolase
MAKYSKKASEKVKATMHEMKEGKLKSGSGKKVTSKKQEVAIGLSEARKEGANSLSRSLREFCYFFKFTRIYTC